MAKTPNKEYRERVKFLRKYVDLSDLNIDLRKELTPSQKRIVTMYYEPLKEAKFYSQKSFAGNKKTVAKIAELQGLEVPRKRLKRVPVQTRQHNAKVKVKRDKESGDEYIEITAKNNRELILKVTSLELLKDAESELKRVIGSKLKEDGGIYTSAQFGVFGYYQLDEFYNVEDGAALFNMKYIVKYPVQNFECLEVIKLNYTGIRDSQIPLPEKKKTKKKLINKRRSRTRMKRKR